MGAAGGAQTVDRSDEARRAGGIGSGADRPRIAFLKVGSFSHTNRALLEILQSAFPDHALDVIDVGRLVRRDPFAFGVGLLAVVRAYGLAVLMRKGARWRAFFGTPWSFHAIRRKLRRRLAGRRYAFTIQTQSLFDGSQPDTPHFVYTDHTARMNRDYGGGGSERGGSIESRISERWIGLEAGIYRHATRVLTQTERAARSVVEDYGADPERVACVFAGGHARPGGGSPASRYEAKRILYVGTSWERKGGPDLLRAFERVRERHPEAELTLVGPAPEIDCPNVRAVGVVPVEALGDYLERATVFCVPTRREPLGFVFLEAADHRLPIVATRIGSLPELVADGESGLLVEVGDVEGLAEALCALLDDPDLCRAFGERGFERLADTYTWANVEKHLVGEIRAALADRGTEAAPNAEETRFDSMP
jgi:glycosyltransferase involved in cell wall biosynthesis